MVRAVRVECRTIRGQWQFPNVSAWVENACRIRSQDIDSLEDFERCEAALKAAHGQ
jgi:hypothetical protein